MAIVARSFRTRSADRDNQTDVQRRNSARAGIVEALKGAQRELQGLQRRITEARQQAAFALDASDEYRARPVEEEQQIVRFEQEAETAARRLVQLRKEVSLFTDLLQTLDRHAGGTPADPPRAPDP